MAGVQARVAAAMAVFEKVLRVIDMLSAWLDQ
jgi:hypothetical protein